MGVVTCRVQSTWLLLCLAIESLGWLCVGHSLFIILEDSNLIGAPFLALKADWGLNQLATEFHSLAIFFKLWIHSLICISPVCPTKGENWLTLYQPRTFYSQPGQLLCACHPMPKPAYPYSTLSASTTYLQNGLCQLITCGPWCIFYAAKSDDENTRVSLVIAAA